MSEEDKPIVTKSGKVLSDADIQALADEAERGYDVSHLKERPNFEGHQPRECHEHRTVGPHRAWCFDCQEWCYPSSPCVRCERAAIVQRLADADIDPVGFVGWLHDWMGV